MLELINLARLDPAGEAASLGIDLNEGLSAGTISSDAKQPLAFNPYLITGARAHSQWMLDNDIFQHNGSDGTSPGDRMEDAGYTFTGSYTWGENIAWQGTTGSLNVLETTKAIEDDLFVDAGIDGRGHRIDLLDPAFREVGLGLVTGNFTEDGTTYHSLMGTQDFAASGSSVFLTGVAYRDTVLANQFYTPGEGLGGITITARSSSGTVYTTTTWSSGGYSLALPEGTYSIIASSATLGTVQYAGITIGSQNVKVDFTADKFSTSNHAPTNIALSATRIAENRPAGSLVGTLSASDVDAGDTLTFSLASGTGSGDNSLFSVSGNQLLTAQPFDYESRSSYSIRLRVSDYAGALYEKVFSISVTGVNEAPTSLSLSRASVTENLAAGTTVGTFSTQDPDAANTFTYKLVSGEGSTNNALFRISGKTLTTAAAFNYEAVNSYSIRVRSTDAGGLWAESVFTISVTDAAEPLVITGTSAANTITANIADGVVHVFMDGVETTAPISNVSRLRIDAGAGNDIVRIDASMTLPCLIYGGDGNDSLYGGSGKDTLYGGNGNDTLRGNDGADYLYGERGYDSLYGGNGNDILRGGTESDRLYGDADQDSLYGESGNDTLHGGTGNDRLEGAAGNDTLMGDDGKDKLYGGDGKDRLDGGTGNDTLDGGAGDDLLYSRDRTSDVLLGGSGRDRAHIDSVIDRLSTIEGLF